MELTYGFNHFLRQIRAKSGKSNNNKIAATKIDYENKLIRWFIECSLMNFIIIVGDSVETVSRVILLIMKHEK